MTISYAEIEDLRNNEDGADRPQDPYSDAPDIDGQLSQLGPNDHVQLAALLRQYPDKQQTILYIAARQCGNACVQRALSMVKDNDSSSAANAAAISADVESSALWTGADAYNAAHTHHVTEFNAVTDGFAMRDGKVDAEKVANWQYDHGLDADGKIGPKTVAAAKKEAATAKAAEPDIAPTQDTPDEDMNGPAIEDQNQYDT